MDSNTPCILTAGDVIAVRAHAAGAPSYTVAELKAGVAAMSTRPFGERFAERILELRYGLKRSCGRFDLSDGSRRVEAKFSRIFAPVSGDTLLDYIVASSGKRFGSCHAPYAANFQKLHPEEFDVLYYGVVFDEHISVYRASRGELTLSNQHLNNAQMKQLNLDYRTARQHDKYLLERLDWDTVLVMLERG